MRVPRRHRRHQVKCGHPGHRARRDAPPRDQARRGAPEVAHAARDLARNPNSGPVLARCSFCRLDSHNPSYRRRTLLFRAATTNRATKPRANARFGARQRAKNEKVAKRRFRSCPTQRRNLKTSSLRTSSLRSCNRYGFPRPCPSHPGSNREPPGRSGCRAPRASSPQPHRR